MRYPRGVERLVADHLRHARRASATRVDALDEAHARRAARGARRALRPPHRSRRRADAARRAPGWRWPARERPADARGRPAHGPLPRPAGRRSAARRDPAARRHARRRLDAERARTGRPARDVRRGRADPVGRRDHLGQARVRALAAGRGHDRQRRHPRALGRLQLHRGRGGRRVAADRPRRRRPSRSTPPPTASAGTSSGTSRSTATRGPASSPSRRPARACAATFGEIRLQRSPPARPAQR